VVPGLSCPAVQLVPGHRRHLQERGADGGRRAGAERGAPVVLSPGRSGSRAAREIGFVPTEEKPSFSGGVTVPGGVQKPCGHGTWGHGIAGTVVMG